MILDSQRNLPGLILLSAVVVLAAVGVLLPLVLSTDRGAGNSEDELPGIPQPPPPVEFRQSNKDYVSAILGQPIFYSDRQLPHEDVVETDATEAVVDVSVPELNAKITGVIVTPESRLAVVQVPGVRNSVVLREGMALDGELAAWKVGAIEARSVNFIASNGQSAKLNMELNERALAAPVSLTPQPVQSAANSPENLTPEEQKERQASLAEEVRRRIAERRAQLRAQRQQQLEQQNEEDNE